jgi:putative ABC transport system permease protein
MNQWLSGFAYRIELGTGVFIVAGGTALLISWITVSYQSIKAAIVNPIKSLRSE